VPFRIRPFTEADYPAIAQVWSTVNQETTSAEFFRWQDNQRDPHCKAARWVAEVAGQVVGFAEYAQPKSFYHPRKFEISGAVLPEHQRQGIGGALYAQVEEALAPFDPLVITAGTCEAWPEAVRFLTSRGYVEKMRNWESHLDVQSFDLAPWEGLMDQVAAKGYAVKSYADLADDPDRVRKLYDLSIEVRRDVPTPEPWNDVPFESWVKVFDTPYFWPEAYFIGLKDGEWVGVSALWRTDEPGVAVVSLTAVRRAHRGTGLAKAMKLRAIRHAKGEGYTTIKTWNESNNHRMLAINEQLGFVRKPAWVYYQKVKPE
jgi:mycothiol synthase